MQLKNTKLPTTDEEFRSDLETIRKNFLDDSVISSLFRASDERTLEFFYQLLAKEPPFTSLDRDIFTIMRLALVEIFRRNLWYSFPLSDS